MKRKTTLFSLHYILNNVAFLLNQRCQEYHNCFLFGELEETTKTSSNYMDEDYPARPEV